MKKLLLFSALLSASISVNADSVDKEITVEKAGTLFSLVSKSDNVTSLKLNGTINRADLVYVDTALTTVKDLNIKDVTIEEYTELGVIYPANEIPAQCFENDSNLVSIVLPSSITKIGDYAFAKTRTTPLENVDFSNCKDLVEIGSHAFDFNSSLSNVDLSNLKKLKKIGDYAFCQSNSSNINLEGCSALEELGERAFAQSYELTSLNLSGLTSLKSIGNRAFLNMCKNSGKEAPLDITIDLSDSSLDSIAVSAFQSTKVTGIKLPATLRVIDDKAFYLSKISETTFYGAVPSMGSSVFASAALEGTCYVMANYVNDYVEAGFVNAKAIEDVNAINKVTDNEKEASVYYDLTGRKIEGSPKACGIYIVGGKKVLVK
ncbi:MAG: leucine-rich repeat domain-containing protein [Bacteroidaceae bacterium]|nr:leucine-rich repeat domain-containing protein [Bacteroidaceae bacterium]